METVIQKPVASIYMLMKTTTTHQFSSSLDLQSEKRDQKSKIVKCNSLKHISLHNKNKPVHIKRDKKRDHPNRRLCCNPPRLYYSEAILLSLNELMLILHIVEFHFYHSPCQPMFLAPQNHVPPFL